MTLPFLEPNDPRLTRVSAAIPLADITGPATKQALEYLHSIAYPEQSDRSKAILVGVSASQLGIPKRIVMVDVKADGHGGVGDLRTYINPVITHHSDRQSEWYEGCYSTAPICGVVSRPYSIAVQAYTPDGQRITETHEGYVARVFQHEIDHLDGKVFIDRISDPTKLHLVQSHEYPKYRDKEGWRNWPHLCPPGYWDTLKSNGRPRADH